MRKIYKYPLKPGEEDFEAPEGAKFLTVQTQGGKPYLWAEVDTDKPLKWYSFTIIGTGHQIPEGYDGEYIGTFQMHDGQFVFHVYKNPEE